MPLRTPDLLDDDFFDAYELASDGYSPYLTTTVVSTNSGTQVVTINLPSDGEGLITGLDHPAQSRDRIRLTGTSGGAADGYYTINLVLTEVTFSVLEPIASSTGGTIQFIYPSGASRIGFDPIGVPHTTAHNVQDAIKEVAFAISGGSFTAYEIEIDFGSSPTRTKTFTIIDASVTPLSHLVILQSGAAPTGRQADENEMDPILFSGTPGSGQFTLIANSLTGPVTGKYKVNYAVG
jgi:hypothetical protein